MPLITRNGRLLRQGLRLASNTACCCTTIYCPTKCSGTGLPLELLFSVTSFAYSGDIVFDPIGDYILTLNTVSCSQYSGAFFAHPPPGLNPPCFPALCFAGCSHKLFVNLFLGSGGGFSVTVADYDSGGIETGGRCINSTDHQSDICAGSFPISGSITTLQSCTSWTMDYELSLP
jgi:hypothetical protein